MQALLTNCALFLVIGYAALMIADFIYGLVRIAAPPQAAAAQTEPEEIATQPTLPQLPDPWELPLDETIAAPQLPTGWALPTLLLLPPATVQEVTRAIETDYGAMNRDQLRKACQRCGVKWRDAKGKNAHLTKAEMITALTALQAA